MKRTITVLAAATLFAGMQAGPALANPRSSLPSCIPLSGGCFPLERLTEDSRIYIVDGPGGQVQGYTNFQQYVQVLQSYGVEVSSRGGALTVSGGDSDYPGDEEPTYPDDEEPTYPNGEEPTYPNGEDEEEPTYPEDEEPTYPEDEEPTYPEEEPEQPGGGHYSFARHAADAGFVSFFDRGDFSGPAFSLGAGGPHNLATIPHPNGGTWSQRISSVIVNGGSPSKKGVVLCAKPNCSQSGWVLTRRNGTEESFAPKPGLPVNPINNAARGVIVLP